MADTQLLVLVLTDLVSSTATVDRLGDRRAAAIGARFDRISRDLLVEHRGSEIDKTDGFLLTFERVLDAVRYAMAMYAALAELSAEEGLAIEARCGIHLGDVVLRENSAEDVARGAKPVEVEGLAKPLAARVMSAAVGGQTLITRTGFTLARRAAHGESDLGDLLWQVHGAYNLKGVSRAVEICEVRRADTGPLVAPPSTEKVKRVGRRRTWPWLAAVAVSALVAMGVWLSMPAGEQVGWYAEVAHTADGLVGVGDLGAKPPAHGVGYVQVTTLDGEVTEVRPHSGDGEPDPSLQGGQVWRQRRDEQGNVVRQLETARGNEVWRVAYERLEDGQVQYAYTNPSGMVAATPYTKGTLARVRERFDAVTGLRSRRQLVTETGERWGLFDLAFERDEHGLVVREEVRDGDGNAAVHPKGWVAKTIERDARHLPIRTSWQGFGGVPVIEKDSGCASITLERDEKGRVQTRQCLGLDGQPAPFKTLGCAAERFAYGLDEVSRTCLNTSGQPIPSKRGVEVVHRFFDTQGLLRRIENTDDNGSPTPDADGAVSIEVAYDEWGRKVGHGPMLGEDGEPVWSQIHGFGWRAQYNDRGQRTSISWVGPDGAPCAGPHGQAVMRTAYDGRGRVSDIRFYDAQSRATMATLPSASTQPTSSRSSSR